MSTFAELVQPVIARHSDLDLRAVLELFGLEASTDLNQLDPKRRAALVDRLVRNLRGMSVVHAPSLERDLLQATGAAPSGHYQWELATETALVDLRSAIRFFGAWLGFDWAQLSRVQAAICGLARWVRSSGSGAMEADAQRHQVHFHLRLTIPGHDAKTVETSPFVVAVREVTSDFVARHEGGTVVVEFNFTQQ
jgi:hypothetical protein